MAEYVLPVMSERAFRRHVHGDLVDKAAKLESKIRRCAEVVGLSGRTRIEDPVKDADARWLIVLAPTYSLKAEDSYIYFARQYLDLRCCLDILDCAGALVGGIFLPSWVPDWRSRPQFRPLLNVPKFRAGLRDPLKEGQASLQLPNPFDKYMRFLCEGHKLNLETALDGTSQRNNVLGLQGYQVGTVNLISKPQTRDSSPADLSILVKEINEMDGELILHLRMVRTKRHSTWEAFALALTADGSLLGLNLVCGTLKRHDSIMTRATRSK